MDDFTINKILLLNKVTKDSFIGVFSSDTLPSYAQTGYYVVNLDTSQQPGSHWIAIKISKNKCKNEYFDSYGLGPPTVCFKRFMKYNYIYNSKRLQHYIHNFLLLAFFTQSHYKSPPFSVCVSFLPQGEKKIAAEE